MNWGGQPEQIGHTLVQIWINTYRATTPIPENQKLTSGVPSWQGAETGAEGSAASIYHGAIRARAALTSREATHYISGNLTVGGSTEVVCIHIRRDTHNFSMLTLIPMNWRTGGRRANPLTGCWTFLISTFALCNIRAVVRTGSWSCILQDVARVCSRGNHILFSCDTPESTTAYIYRRLVPYLLASGLDHNVCLILNYDSMLYCEASYGNSLEHKHLDPG